MTIDGKASSIQKVPVFGSQTENRRFSVTSIVEPPDPLDRLELSVSSLSLRQERRFTETPEMRAKRIEEIRHRIRTSTYNIRAEAVAEAILAGAVIHEEV